jgi:DNA recombination protein RmuC
MNTLELILLVVAVTAVAGFFWAFMGWQKAKARWTPPTPGWS